MRAPGLRARVPDSAILRLVRAAVRFADAIEQPESLDPTKPDYCQRFIAADEESREAMLAYARSLGPSERRRLGA